MWIFVHLLLSRQNYFLDYRVNVWLCLFRMLKDVHFKFRLSILCHWIFIKGRKPCYNWNLWHVAGDSYFVRSSWVLFCQNMEERDNLLHLPQVHSHGIIRAIHIQHILNLNRTMRHILTTNLHQLLQATVVTLRIQRGSLKGNSQKLMMIILP